MIEISMDVVYTQNPSEQAIILRKASQFAKAGTILEIGANDGSTYSNSLALINAGWRGILVEPSPYAFAKLFELHGANERVTLLNAAIGIENRIVKFFECEDTLYSTTLESKAVELRKAGKKVRSYWVPQLTVSKMLEQLGGSADILSIDIEGASVDVLMVCPIGSWDTKFIIVEHDSRIVELSGWARAHEFEVCGVTAENLMLAR